MALRPVCDFGSPLRFKSCHLTQSTLQHALPSPDSGIRKKSKHVAGREQEAVLSCKSQKQPDILLGVHVIPSQEHALDWDEKILNGGILGDKAKWWQKLI